jgi:hypothetical protein
VRFNDKINAPRRSLSVMSGAILGAATQSQAQSPVVRTVRSERLFYVVAGSVMLIATLVGFRSFLAHGKGIGGGEITRQIVPLVVVHGLAMFKHRKIKLSHYRVI